MPPPSRRPSDEARRREADEEQPAGTVRPQAPPDAASSDEAAPGDYPGAALLRRKTPEDVYSAISQADPLHLSDRCARELRATHFLLDAERLHERALVRVAYAAMDYRGDPPFGEWLRWCIRLAIRDLLRQDWEMFRTGTPLVHDRDPRYSFLIYTLALEPARTVPAAVRFNGLGPRPRWAFFELLLHQRNLDEVVAESGATLEEVIRWAQDALEALYEVKLGKNRRTEDNEDADEAEADER